jgi:hypothetical protein
VHKSIKLVLLLLLTGVAAATTNAQSPSSPPIPLKYYKADFVVKEVDATGHVTNSRSYSTILATNNQPATNQIRSGNRIPFRTGLNEKGDTEIQYVDIGVNIDCRNIQEIDQKLAMLVKAEVSSIPGGTNSTSELGPIIRQFQWNSDVLILPGTPTTIFSSDDVNNKTRMQLEVTATLVR